MKLQVEKRTEVGSSAAKRARMNKKITAVIYGKDVEATPVLLDAKDFDGILKNLGINAIFDVAVSDGKTAQVIIKDVQVDSLSNQIYNVALQAIKKGQKLTMSVPIHLEGAEEVTEGILSQTLNVLEIETISTNIPTEFVIDVSKMKIGEALTVADIIVDKDITILADAEETVAVVAAPAAEEETTPAAATEPAVIGEKPKA